MAKKEGKWTQFMDMHSGGGQKLDWAYIYIEAPEDEAKAIFFKRFGRNPERVTCTCCGSDYSLTESDSLEQATAYQRGCEYSDSEKKWIERGPRHKTLDEYLKTDIKVIYAKDIKPEERRGEVPEEGYVWEGD